MSKKRKRKRGSAAAGDLLNIPGFLKRKDGAGSTFERVTAPPPRQSAAASSPPSPAAPAAPGPLKATVPEPGTVAEWASCIAEEWSGARDRFLRCGQRLLDAKAALPHGDFQRMIAEKLPFSARTAQKLMRIAEDERIMANAAHGPHLPPSWRTLYELTRLDDDVFEQALQSGRIRADMSRAEVLKIARDAEAEALKAENAAGAAEDDVGAPGIAGDPGAEMNGDVLAGLADLAAAGRKFAAILADPPWPFETFSDKGKDRGAERHYPTMAVDAIQALPVADVAMDDCVLFLWATMPQLPAALATIAAWGFAYKTCGFAWVKQNPKKGTKGGGLWRGMGLWTRANVELCLLATRGAPRRYATDVEQVIAAPVGRHSEKPREAHDRLMRLVRGPYLELFARRCYPGWTAIGDQLGGRRRADDEEAA